MIRLTGGEWNGRPIQTPKNLKTRPTQAKLRQALFNSIQFELPEAQVLDLFSGSGVLAFEALSRGAQRATLVEKALSAVQVIERNCASLGIELGTPSSILRVIHEPIPKALSQIEAGAPYSIVFADPPYADGWELKILNEFPWESLLSDGGVLCLEWSLVKSRFPEKRMMELPEQARSLQKIREKAYGDSCLTHYRKKI